MKNTTKGLRELLRKGAMPKTPAAFTRFSLLPPEGPTNKSGGRGIVPKLNMARLNDK